MLVAISGLPPKNADVIIKTISILAAQGINVARIIVILLSFSSSIVLHDIIAGTPQPVPITIGIKDFPDRPNLLNILSNINATLAMYPLSSSIESNKNKIAI